MGSSPQGPGTAPILSGATRHGSRALRTAHRTLATIALLAVLGCDTDDAEPDDTALPIGRDVQR